MKFELVLSFLEESRWMVMRERLEHLYERWGGEGIKGMWVVV